MRSVIKYFIITTRWNERDDVLLSFRVTFIFRFQKILYTLLAAKSLQKTYNLTFYI